MTTNPTAEAARRNLADKIQVVLAKGGDHYDVADAILAAYPQIAPDDGADRVISDLLIASASYADMDETGRLPKAREQAERLLSEPDLSAKQRYANHYEEQIGFLVERFAEALSSKLRKAEEKYQYQGAWRRDNWHDALVQQIRRHMDKGDPLDVAAYCAFAWHHGWTLAAPHTSAAAYPQIAPPQDVVERARKVADNWYRRDQHWHEPLAKQIAAFATAHAAREREACARVADAAASDWDITRSGPKSIAAAIRARKP